MYNSKLYDLASETAIFLRSQISEMNPDKRKQLALNFAADLENISGINPEEQWRPESDVRGLRFSPQVLGIQSIPKLHNLYEAARSAFGLVRWTEFYEDDDWSRPFLSNFANGEGFGPDGRLHHSSIILGLFVLGPNSLYPPHAHPGEEFYIVLSGHPEWLIGAGESYNETYPGSVMIHRSNECHSIRTIKEPLFAVFGWRGNIRAPSWYRKDMTDESEEKLYPKIRKG